MKNLPHYYTRRWFAGCIVILSLMGFTYRLLLLGEALPAVFLHYALPLLIFGLVYHAEYHRRILEKVCQGLKKDCIFFLLLPMLVSGIAAVFHHHVFLNWFLPLGFLLCQWAIEKEEHAVFNSRLAGLLVQSVLFLGLSLKFTHHGAAAVTVSVMAIVLLLRLMVYGCQEEWDFWKSTWGLTTVFLWIAALFPGMLERLLFISVCDKDSRIMSAGMELFSAAHPWGQAELILSDISDLLPYAPGWLTARYGWLSLVPLMVVTGALAVSGFCLCFRGISRHTTTLAIGCYILLMCRFASYILKGISVFMGFDGLPFFDANPADMLLAVVIMQPLNPKQLSDISPDDEVDFEMQELAALILLPHTREGAQVLALYAFDNPNYLAWAVLRRRFWRFFDEAERQALQMNSADIFSTHDYLKLIRPDHREEDNPCITLTS